MPVGIFDDEGERLKGLIKIICLLIIVAAACNGLHLKKTDAQNGTVGQFDNHLADEWRVGDSDAEVKRILINGIADEVRGTKVSCCSFLSGITEVVDRVGLFHRLNRNSFER